MIRIVLLAPTKNWCQNAIVRLQKPAVKRGDAIFFGELSGERIAVILPVLTDHVTAGCIRRDEKRLTRLRQG